MENNDDKKIRIAIKLSVIVIVAIVVYSIVSWVMTIGKVSVKVIYAPFAAKVLINGQEYKNNANHYLAPGKYNVEVKFDNFETLSEDVEVTMETEYLYGSLLANEEVGKQYANEHMDEFLAVEGVAGYLANKEGEAMRKKLLGEAPVVASLPVKNSLFLITYTQDEEQKVKITISALNTYMDEAVKKFKSLLGKDEYLHQYDVEFLGYDNLLAGTFADNNESDPVEYLKKGFSGIDSFNIVTTSECGDYVCAKMTTGGEKTYTLMTYKAIMGKNVDGKWEILGGPLPFLTKFNADGIADEILVFANEL